MYIKHITSIIVVDTLPGLLFTFQCLRFCTRYILRSPVSVG